MDFNQIILKLTKWLYPTGRAFTISDDSWKEGFYKGLIKSENRAYNDSIGILNSILPDNDDFSIEDASNWERRLGIFGNEASTLQIRKTAILRKMQHPGQAKARQHYLYIEGELQKAGFDVYVHENTAGLNPVGVVGVQFSAIHSTGLQHGQTRHGRKQVNVVANSIYQSVDNTFIWDKVFTGEPNNHSNVTLLNNIQHNNFGRQSVDSTFNNMFFIGGQILGDYVNIPAEREVEFRSLILSLKPVQTIGVLLINYI